MAKFIHLLNRLFWSLYFVMTIAIIGTLFGYLLTFFLFVLAKVIKPLHPPSSKVILDFTERFYASSIHFLLKLQPWLHYKTNLPRLSQYRAFINHQCQTRRLLYVANHRSNLDTFLLISLIPGLRGLAKSSLFYNFFFAPFMWIVGFIPVEKGNAKSFIDGLDRLRTELLANEIPVLIFPENTRCSKGSSKLNKWGQAVFKMAIEAKATIIPIALKNTDTVLGRGDLLLTPFRPIQIKMLTPVEAQEWKDCHQLSKTVHQLLATELP